MGEQTGTVSVLIRSVSMCTIIEIGKNIDKDFYYLFTYSLFKLTQT